MAADERERSAGTRQTDDTGCGGSDSSGVVLDRAALDAIRALDDGRGQLLAQVIALYMESAPPLVEQIRRGLHEASAEAVRMAAHTLKSSSANIGALRLSAVCKGLEHAARAGRLNDELPDPDAVARELEAVRLALEQEL